MSKLMSVLGIVLLAIGVSLALLGFVSPDRIPSQLLLQGFLQTSATLIVGGILSLGLGGVIGALQSGRPAATFEDVSEPVERSAPPQREERVVEPPPAPISIAPAVAETTAPSSRLRFPGFGRKADVPSAPAEAAIATASLSPAVRETVEALEQAKTDLTNAMGGLSSAAEPPPPPPRESSAEAAGDDLYVVEDKVIRGRPARILSDGTVEAETDEGWMRFENLEHLNEYLDSVQPE